MQKFDKAMLKKEIENNARKLFRRELTELNEKEAFHAVAAAIQNQIIDDWILTTKRAEEDLLSFHGVFDGKSTRKQYPESFRT